LPQRLELDRELEDAPLRRIRKAQRRLGHAAIAIMEKYLRDTLALDTEKL
jgi:hypothetical protein